MKKTAKIILIICCAALFLFLLLPFLETQAPQQAGQQNTEAKAEPQIFTSNPLTELVGRIARFFGAKKSALSSQTPQTLTNAQAAEAFGEPQDNALYASAAPASGGQTSGTVSGDGGAYTNAYFQNEDGNWVLIRQTTPEGASRGMHEVNVKDNAYDTYVHQERQARFTPVMRTPKTKEVPDSKLARVFSPLKRLFGFGEENADSGARRSQDAGNFAAGKLASSDGLDRNGEKTAILPKTRPVNWNGFGSNPFSSLEPGGAEATKALANMIFPEAALKEMAEMLADIKFPNADNDPQQQQAKQDFKEQWMLENLKTASEEASAILQEKGAGEQENVLSDIMQGCFDKIASVKNPCKGSEEKESQELAEKVPQELVEKNKKSFFEQTGLHLPPAGITVVLHKTDLPLPNEEELLALVRDDEDDEESQPPLPDNIKHALEMYHYMQEHCEGNCYWVATGKDPEQELHQRATAAGFVPKGDPLNLLQKHIDNFLDDLIKEGSLTEEQAQERRKALEKLPYAMYSQEEVQQLQRQTLDLLLERAKPEDASVPFFAQAATALQYYNDTDTKFPLFYGAGSATAEGTLEESSAALTNDVANFVNDMRPIIQRIKQRAAQEGIKDLSSPRIQEIFKELMQDMKNFKEGNDIGTYQK